MIFFGRQPVMSICLPLHCKPTNLQCNYNEAGKHEATPEWRIRPLHCSSWFARGMASPEAEGKHVRRERGTI